MGSSSLIFSCILIIQTNWWGLAGVGVPLTGAQTSLMERCFC